MVFLFILKTIVVIYEYINYKLCDSLIFAEKISKFFHRHSCSAGTLEITKEGASPGISEGHLTSTEVCHPILSNLRNSPI